MIPAALRYRSGRVIALLRLVLALAFLAALFFEPTQPVREGFVGHLLLMTYIGLATALLLVAWHSWWYDTLLRFPMFFVDVAVFALSIYFTEGASQNFNSPFLAFYVFLMVSALFRFHAWHIFFSGSLIILAYLAVGLVMSTQGLEFDLQQFLRRVTYMFLILLVFGWFETQRREIAVERYKGSPSDDAYDAALRYVLEQTSAQKVGLLWEEPDEPARMIWRSRDADLQVASSGDLPEIDDYPPALFDMRRSRSLVLHDDGRLRAQREAHAEPLAGSLSLDSGITVPLTTPDGSVGRLAVSSFPGISVEEIIRLVAIGREVAGILQQERLTALARQSAIVTTRAALARDLHDSVAQSLAGASFALEALRRSIDEPREVLAERIDAMKSGMVEEQANIRRMIDRLLVEPDDLGAVNLAAELQRVIEEDARRWHVSISHEGDDDLLVATVKAFEFSQLLREGIANAVRHGGARNLTIRYKRGEGGVTLSVSDDGKGFPPDWDGSPPWSVNQRAVTLGGTSSLTRIGSKTELSVTIPAGEKR